MGVVKRQRRGWRLAPTGPSGRTRKASRWWAWHSFHATGGNARPPIPSRDRLTTVPFASEPEAAQRIARGAGAPLDHLGEHAVDPALAPQDADLDDELRERLARADGQPVPLLRVARLIGGERALRLARNGAHLVQQMPLGAGGDGAAPSGHDRVLDRPQLA